MGGFCFVVAELLAAKHPDAQLCRLTNRDRTTYRHVFVRIDGEPCDIKGSREVSDMVLDLDDAGLIEEPVSPEAVRNYFYPRYEERQLASARVVLAPFVAQELS